MTITHHVRVHRSDENLAREGQLAWALARVAEGDGALAGKFRHPSVAPYIRAMQRQVTQIEALLA